MLVQQAKHIRASASPSWSPSTDGPAGFTAIRSRPTVPTQTADNPMSHGPGGRAVKKQPFSVEQITSALQGVSVGNVCRQVGISEQTFHR
jgi:hypothetical protein